MDASDKGPFVIGSSAFIEEYARTRQIPVPKLLHAFGIDLVCQYMKYRASHFINNHPFAQCPELQDRRPATMLYFLRVAMSHQWADIFGSRTTF